ncbi:MAG: M48 family metalloprotease [Thiomicrorhabdus chilensis]|uniref:M48 family metalloprotease n=1 Tax=Thiomicrorhabdus chilensis TaxID=63656 RepID=UPI00299EEF18|nr:M48 family metalloprotease [Thiomicrorhabdus chilensis]MDX1346725.1 M48 family metalloprotease [Thiomicrorhabdus chilensis]
MPTLLLNQKNAPPGLLTLVIIVGFCLYLISINNVYANNLPNLGSSDLIEYTQEKEQALGRAFKNALHSEHHTLSDPDISSYIQRIGHKIAQQSGDHRNFSFYVIQHPDINAFAGPDGVIGIHTGLIRAVNSEDELASVVAHEIAHVTQNHLSRTYELRSGSSLTHLASFIAAILIGMHDSSAGMATLMGGMGASMQQQLKYSRTHESEADYAGIEYLYKSGYSPFAMSDFFGRLSLEYQNREFKPTEILSTHPVTERRLAESKSRAESYPPLIMKIDNESLTLIKLKLQAISQQKDETLRPATFTLEEQCYQQALETLHSNSNNIEGSTQCLRKARQNNPQQRLYPSLLFDLYLNANETQTNRTFENWIKEAKFAHELFPQDPAIFQKYIRILIKDKQTLTAIEALEKETPNYTYQFELYKLLSSLYAQSGQTAYAYYFEALAHFNIGNLQRTQIYLNKANEQSSPKDIRLQGKIRDFKRTHANLLKEKNKKD